MSRMRSKLFVPGNRADLMSKAMDTQADAVSIDLEDAVPEGDKENARRQLSLFLKACSHRRLPRPELVVRVNPVGGEDWERDLAAAAVSGVSQINLPKVERPEMIHRAAELLDALECENGAASPISFLVNIETPAALSRARELAQAHPRVAGLQIGFGDLFLSCGIARENDAAIAYVRMTVCIAAAQVGIPCYDGAYVHVHDDAGLSKEAHEARSFGLSGKSCIHPRQVAIVNSAFEATQAQRQWAQKVVMACAQSKDPAQGTFLIDGEMVDEAVLKRARRLLSGFGG